MDLELDLLTDIYQYLFNEEGIRGEVAMISNQYALAKAHGMENYDVSKRNNYIMYLDANNLYGWVVSLSLPTSNFKWFTEEEMKNFDVMMKPDDSPRVCILECDLGKYYFCCLYIYVYFITCKVSLLCILEYPRDFMKCNFSFLCISEYPHELHDLLKDYPLAPETHLATNNVTFCKMRDSANLHPGSSRIYAEKRTTSVTIAI